MKLDDLNRPHLMYRVRWWAMLATTVSAVLVAGMIAYEAHKLIGSNAILVDLVYTKIDSIADARVAAIHREFDEALRAALTGGGAVAVDRLLQRSADK